jgi:hypothetical protein
MANSLSQALYNLREIFSYIAGRHPMLPNAAAILDPDTPPIVQNADPPPGRNAAYTAK